MNKFNPMNCVYVIVATCFVAGFAWGLQAWFAFCGHLTNWSELGLLMFFSPLIITAVIGVGFMPTPLKDKECE